MDRLTFDRIAHQGLLVLLAGLWLLACLLPLSVTGAALPGPDLLTALVAAWVLRRPDYVPVLLAAGLFILADILLQRPPGLRAGLMVLAVEFLRSRARFARDLPFLAEWFMVAGVLSLVLVAERVALGLVMADEASFGRTVLQLGATLAAYPLVVVLSVTVFGVRRVRPGEDDALRRGLA